MVLINTILWDWIRFRYKFRLDRIWLVVSMIPPRVRPETKRSWQTFPTDPKNQETRKPNSFPFKPFSQPHAGFSSLLWSIEKGLHRPTIHLAAARSVWYTSWFMHENLWVRCNSQFQPLWKIFVISQLGWLLPFFWKRRNVPNHQPVEWLV